MAAETTEVHKHFRVQKSVLCGVASLPLGIAWTMHISHPWGRLFFFFGLSCNPKSAALMFNLMKLAASTKEEEEKGVIQQCSPSL